MNFQSMEYFLAVEHYRSFTKAAESLYITQQTLSSHIAKIESEINCRLFVRTVPLELTYAGEVFLNYAKIFEQNYSRMQRDFSDIANETKGRIRIGIAYTRGRVLLPDVIEEFQKAYPKMEVQLLEDSNEHIIENLRDNRVDLIVASMPDKVPEVVSEELYPEEIVLAVSKRLLAELYGDEMLQVCDQAKENLSVLQECPFLLNSKKDLIGRYARDILEAMNFTPFIKAGSESQLTLMEFCLRGSGACFFSKRVVEEVLTTEQKNCLQIIEFQNIHAYISFRVAWKKTNSSWKVLKDFIKCLKGVTWNRPW